MLLGSVAPRAERPACRPTGLVVVLCFQQFHSGAVVGDEHIDPATHQRTADGSKFRFASGNTFYNSSAT